MNNYTFTPVQPRFKQLIETVEVSAESLSEAQARLLKFYPNCNFELLEFYCLDCQL